MFNKIYVTLKSFIKNNYKFLIFISILLIMLFVRLPYEVEMPGGIIDLSNRIKVNGNTPDIDGSFNMAYVSTSDGYIPYILIGLINPNWEVTKNSDFVASNETIDDYQKRDVIFLEQSKQNATIVALDAAGIPYEKENPIIKVMYISAHSDTDMKIGDEILKVDNVVIKEGLEITNIINHHQEGDKIKVLVKRDNKEIETTAEIHTDPDNTTYIDKETNEERPRLIIGVSTATMYDIKCDVDIDITSKDSESGPSGGMMMSLMIYNALTNQDLTNGKKIVGTGTINLDGTVGAIGGVKYKIMGAHKAKADIFLVPRANYDEAKKVVEDKKYKLTLVPLDTLQDAIDYLEGKDE